MKFSDALDRKMEEIERPTNPPLGHYIWQVTKHPETGTFDSKNTGDTFSRLDFACTIVAPHEDVDSDELEEYGNVQGFVSRKSFLFNESEGKEKDFDRSMFQLRQFFEAMGLEPDMAINEAMAAAQGQQFLGELTHRADPNDPDIVYAEIRKTTTI